MNQKVVNFGVGKSAQEATKFCQAVGMDLPSDELAYATTYLFEEIQRLVGGRTLLIVNFIVDGTVIYGNKTHSLATEFSSKGVLFPLFTLFSCTSRSNISGK